MKFRTIAGTAAAAMLLMVTTTGCAGNLANNAGRLHTTNNIGGLRTTNNVPRDTYRGGSLARDTGVLTRDGLMRTAE
jgi:hypothetical protein